MGAVGRLVLAGMLASQARSMCMARRTLGTARPMAQAKTMPASYTAARTFWSTVPRRNADGSDEEMEARRRWVSAFEPIQLRRNDMDVTFSRSSGPGGQNVNKLNTKANVRLDLSQAGAHAHDSLDAAHPRKWLTRDIVSRIAKASPYYVASDHSMLVTSMRHRTQEANVQDALEKMHAHILELAQDGLVGETSQEQRDRVKRLQQAEARRKKTNKIKRADVKSGRKFKG